MTTHTNHGTSPRALAASCHGVRELDQVKLDTWDDAIGALDVALTDAAAARRDLADAQSEMDCLEAAVMLRIEGGNAEQRKARITLALAELPAYQGVAAEARNARVRLADAGQRATIAKERCRLVRAALTTRVNGE